MPPMFRNMRMKYLRMDDLNLSGARVLIRVDLNVPVEHGRVRSDARIKAILPTVRLACAAGGRVMMMSHLGRPPAGAAATDNNNRFSLQPVAKRLSELLDQEVPLKQDWLDGIAVEPGQAVLCENVRLQPGEMTDDEQLSRRMAALCDVFVMDAFGTAHRAQASTHGVARFAPVACAGPLLCSELETLERAMEAPRQPLVVVLGGAKVSTKLELIENLIPLAGRMILGGAIANTFLAAEGHPVGQSLYEADLVDTARRIDEAMRRRGGDILLPTDVVVAHELSETTDPVVRASGELSGHDMILDIGPDTRKNMAVALDAAGTIIWNGPLGVFECKPFAEGTHALVRAIAGSSAYSIAGGGDTLAAIETFSVASQISYISTGGGAFLQFLAGKILPAVAILEERAQSQ